MPRNKYTWWKRTPPYSIDSSVRQAQKKRYTGEEDSCGEGDVSADVVVDGVHGENKGWNLDGVEGRRKDVQMWPPSSSEEWVFKNVRGSQEYLEETALDNRYYMATCDGRSAQHYIELYTAWGQN
ncbi:hypothetical protein EDC04DRAFT_2607513 [Pisolithus marmoratus]|nr:hypothetical protein EDC04DRAFT_2607513 [Pisolithus marmoratus]